jgi:hypothetical protein
VGHGGLALGLTGAREAVEWWRDGGEGSGGAALSAGSLGVRREGKEGWGRSGEEWGCRGAFCRVGEGAGRPNREGNQAAAAAAFSRLHLGEEGSRAGPTW